MSGPAQHARKGAGAHAYFGPGAMRGARVDIESAHQEWTDAARLAVEKHHALVETVRAINQAADIYEDDPVNVHDRPESWGKLDALLEAVERARAVLAAIDGEKVTR